MNLRQGAVRRWNTVERVGAQRSRRLTCSLVGIAAIVGSGCGDRQLADSFMPPPAPRISRFLAADAATQLDANGQFILPAPARRGNRPEIDATQAVALAEGWARDLAPGLLPMLRSQHRGPINLAGLRHCGRVFYAESPHEELPAELPAVYHRTNGSWWLVTMCAASGEPTVSVAVSAYDTHLSLRDGHLVYPLDQTQGQEFWASGIPRDLHGALPLPPEEAVRLVSELTGRRVVATPQLITPGSGNGMPQTARWRVKIDRPSALRHAADARAISADEIFASVVMFKEPPYLSVASPLQPDGRDVRWVSEAAWRAIPRGGAARGQRPLNSVTHLARRAGVPVVFDRVTTQGGQ